MLAKITSKNQLTLPKSVTETIGPVEYFDVETRAGQIILTPVRIQRGDAVRAKLAALDLSDADIRNAVDWARADEPARQVAEERTSYRAPAQRKRARAKSSRGK